MLQGCVVLDCTGRLGWLAGRLLADLGAEVIKLEVPGADVSSSDWCALNVNKRLVRVDPSDPGGQRELDQLAATADILIATPRPSSDEARIVRLRASLGDQRTPDRRRDHAVRTHRSQGGLACLGHRNHGRRRGHVARRRARRRAVAGKCAAVLCMGGRPGGGRGVDGACGPLAHRARTAGRCLGPGRGDHGAFARGRLSSTSWVLHPPVPVPI